MLAMGPQGWRVVTLPTLVRLASSQAGSPAGKPISLSASVVVLGDGSTAAAPSGQVAFRAGGRVLGTVALGPDGTAVLEGVLLPAGFYGIVASYGGDAEHAAAASAPLPQAVLAPGLPVVVAVAAPRVSPEGVTLEAELLDAVSGRLAQDAEGEVVFVAGDREVARAAVRGGQARAVVPEEPRGPLEAHFGGGPDHAPGHGFRPDREAGA